MIKELKRVTTIQAEQFDGSEKMIDKYDLLIEFNSDLIADGNYCLKTSKSEIILRVDDWIATGDDDEHWVIYDSTLKKHYVEVKQW